MEIFLCICIKAICFVLWVFIIGEVVEYFSFKASKGFHLAQSKYMSITIGNSLFESLAKALKKK